MTNKSKKKTKNNKEEFSIDEMEKAQKDLFGHYLDVVGNMLFEDSIKIIEEYGNRLSQTRQKK